MKKINKYYIPAGRKKIYVEKSLFDEYNRMILILTILTKKL